MLWGPGQSEDFVGESKVEWGDTLLTPKKEILAFNEPNLRDQASMEPDAAARIWIQDLEPLRAKGFRLGAPVTTNAPDSVTWMKVRSYAERDGFVSCWANSFRYWLSTIFPGVSHRVQRLVHARLLPPALVLDLGRVVQDLRRPLARYM